MLSSQKRTCYCQDVFRTFLSVVFTFSCSYLPVPAERMLFALVNNDLCLLHIRNVSFGATLTTLATGIGGRSGTVEGKSSAASSSGAASPPAKGSATTPELKDEKSNRGATGRETSSLIIFLVPQFSSLGHKLEYFPMTCFLAGYISCNQRRSGQGKIYPSWACCGSRCCNRYLWYNMSLFAPLLLSLMTCARSGRRKGQGIQEVIVRVC